MSENSQLRSPMRPDKKNVSAATKQKQKLAIAVIVLLVPVSFCIYLILAPRSEPQDDGLGGVNATMPDGKRVPIEGTKTRAIEQAEAIRRENERIQEVAASSFSLLPDDSAKPSQPVRSGYRQSQRAYMDVTRQMNAFYNRRPDTSEIEKLRRELAAVKAQTAERNTPPVDPTSIMERSYELAAKYLNTRQRMSDPATCDSEAGTTTEPTALAVRPTIDRTVSALPQVPTDTGELTAQGRQTGFYTAVGGYGELVRNARRACISGDQVISSGNRIRLRLLETLQAGTVIVPVNTEIFGTAKITGQRLHITVTSIEVMGNIIPVSLAVHDLDGQTGLFVPDLKERTAAKNAAAGIGASLGSGINITRNASQQIAMDVVRGVMNGGSQYAAEKLREVKVAVKSNYQLLLIINK